MDQKICKSCQNLLPSSLFWKRDRGKGGLFANCISCEKNLNKHRIRLRTTNGPTEIVSEKKCSSCRETKPIDDFYKDKSKPSGRCSSCKTCSDNRANKWSEDNWDRRMAVAKKRLENAPYKVAYGSAFWRDSDAHEKLLKDAARAAQKYRSTNRGKGAVRNASRAYLFKNRERFPAWADKEAIIKFYGDCPDGYVVDHIIPINGQQVCGLHVRENLQYLTKAENAKKGNKFAYPSLFTDEIITHSTGAVGALPPDSD